MSAGTGVHPAQAGPAQAQPRAIPVRVMRVVPISPSMVRITLASDDLRHFSVEGADQWLRLFLPRAGQREPVLPSTEAWWPEICALDERIQPIVRNYTVRRVRPFQGELDIDVVRHGDSGPATRWAGRARVDDRIGILDQSTTYQPPLDAPWRLLLGDESALPAIGSIIEGLPPGSTAVALVEIPSPNDIQGFETAADLTVHWLPRSGDQRVGSRILHALQSELALPGGSPYVFLAGEQRLVRNVRRHLVGAWGYPRESICFMSYWRLGR